MTSGYRPDPRLDALRGNVAGLVWPAIQAGPAASLASLVLQLDRSQWLDAATIAARQFAQLALLARHFADRDAGFRARLAEDGLDAADLARPDGLVRLTPLDRRRAQGFDPVGRAAAEAMLPAGHAPVERYNTSGSTGEPVRVWRSAVNRLVWTAMTIRYHLWDEPDLSGRLAAIRANQDQFGERPDWGEAVALLLPTGPALMVDIVADIAEQHRRLAAFRPDSVMVYPSNLAALLDLIDAGAAPLDSVQRWRMLGETLDPGLAQRAAAMTGARVSDCYSSQEIGYLALQCPDAPESYHVMAEGVLVEIVDEAGRPAAPGTIGRVLVTDLHNFATPMIRYDIGDYASPGPPCRCGRGLPVIARIHGRARNLITNPDGTRHWPLTGYKRMRDYGPIRQYQMRQRARDRIELHLVADRPLDEAETAALVAYLQTKLRYPFAIELHYHDDRLPTGPSGKFEEFVSQL